ncbi:hypothetical protein BD769DRAFT_1639443 [Suillus cothurnatus]|nr:hypothetical protein BD769DRAFT_1639443 [Suillus cothurnatus]
MTRKSAKTSPITEMRQKARKFNVGLSDMVLLRFGCLLSVIERKRAGIFNQLMVLLEVDLRLVERGHMALDYLLSSRTHNLEPSPFGWKALHVEEWYPADVENPVDPFDVKVISW